MRVVLDLLNEFTNTIVVSLFHNRMWQSRNSEVDVNLVFNLVLVICITANNGFLRSIVIWVWDFVGLIGNFWIVEQLLPLVVEQLLNPILSSSHVSRKSLEEDEVTQNPSRT